MNEPLDSFEAELAALRPHEASPALRQRIAHHQTRSRQQRTRGRWVLACAGGLVAACVAGAIILRWANSQGNAPDQIVITFPPQPPHESADAQPTLLAYQRALAGSPGGLDALLDEQAMLAPEPSPELVTFSAFTRSHAALHALLGDD
jgi:hypothetical protein